MNRIPARGARKVRSLFVSDIHLGCKHSQAEAFLEFLHQHEPEYLYVVGDFIDGWKLKRRWRWTPVYNGIFKRLLTLRRRGTKLFYTPGNHDAFLRGFLADFSVLQLVNVGDQFIHCAADGRRFLVLHGDKFDRFENHIQWVSKLAAIGYDVLLTANRCLNRLRGNPSDPYAFCAMAKRRVKIFVKHMSDFERLLTDSARHHRCDGIICGHIHMPRIADWNDLFYCNTGDWVENCSALVEYDDGQFELLRRDGRVIGRVQPTFQPPMLPEPREVPEFIPLDKNERPVLERVLVA